jgi:hypothetical protein
MINKINRNGLKKMLSNVKSDNSSKRTEENPAKGFDTPFFPLNQSPESKVSGLFFDLAQTLKRGAQRFVKPASCFKVNRAERFLLYI